MSNLATSSGSPTNRTVDQSIGGNGSSFVRLSLSPEPSSSRNDNDDPSTSAGSATNQGASAGASTVSKRVANILVSPLRKRPSTDEAGSSSGTTASRPVEPMTAIRLPLSQPVVNLSPSRTVEMPGPNGGTTYRYSYPYSPPHRPEDRQSSTINNATDHHAVPIKRRRLNFGTQTGETSTAGSSSAGTTQGFSTSLNETPDLNRGYSSLPSSAVTAAAAAAAASVSVSQGNRPSNAPDNPNPTYNLRLPRRDRPNIVLYVPRESSRLTSAAANATSAATQTQDRSSILNGLRAGWNARRYIMVGSPPRFERVDPRSHPASSPLVRQQPDQMAHNQPFVALRERPQAAPQNQNGNNGDNNNNDDEWEYSYDLNRAVNRAIAGAFIGAGDTALANNILDMTCRIQRWTTNIVMGKYPDLTKTEENVIVSKCKLHNDGSVSINDSGTLLAAFVENSAPDRSLWAHTTLKIVSLRPEDRGAILYEKTFGPNAISVSFSPADGRHVLIGLASRRYLRLRHSPQTCAMIFSLRNANRNGVQKGVQPGELKLAMCVEHDQSPPGPLFGGGVVGGEEAVNLLTFGFRVDSVNCWTWLATPGQGLCYGTNRGKVFILTPKREESDETEAADNLLASSDVPRFFQRQSARWNIFEAEGEREQLLSGNGNLIV